MSSAGTRSEAPITVCEMKFTARRGARAHRELHEATSSVSVSTSADVVGLPAARERRHRR